MVKKISDAIVDLGYAVKAKGIEPTANIAIKLKSRAFDELVEEIKATMGPDNQRNLPPNMQDVKILGIKVTRTE